MGLSSPTSWLPRSRHHLYGPGLDGRPGRDYRPRRWYHWDNLRLYLAAVLATVLTGVLITDCTNGTTEHELATVQDRFYHPAYWSWSTHRRTTGSGKNQQTTYYLTHDYHPAWWELVVQDWEGVQHLRCTETYYYQVHPGQQVPLSYRRGRWTKWRWGLSLEDN